MRIVPARKPNKYVTTRRGLLSHLWGIGLTNVNVWREGPFYACRVGDRVFATHVRALRNTTFNWWEERVKANYFPF